MLHGNKFENLDEMAHSREIQIFENNLKKRKNLWVLPQVNFIGSFFQTVKKFVLEVWDTKTETMVGIRESGRKRMFKRFSYLKKNFSGKKRIFLN